MSLRLMGKKRGMTQIFDDKGSIVPCTVIEIEPNIVTQVKTHEKDGYNAIQMGFDKVKVKDQRTIETRVSRPIRGHYKKAGVEPRRHLSETRVEKIEGFEIGQEFGVEAFAEVAYVDACGISKGKGFQGVIKLHHYSGGPAAHGSSFHRHAGSTGMRSTPGRCLPGGKRASHMGYDRITVQNIRVVAVHPEENIILLEGQVPGPRNGIVYLNAAVKKPKTNVKKR